MPPPSQVDELLRRLSAMPATSQVDGQVIRAYHGSPYDWDKVDMSMVGKGEGPLDEGFGFYASSQEGVGNWYRHRTTAIRRRELADQLREIRAGTRASPADLHEPGKELEWHRKLQHARRLAQEVRPQLSRLQRQFPRGRTYELEIGVPESSLLQWDRPIRYQEGLHDRLRSVDPKLFDDLVEAAPVDLGADGRAFADDGASFYNFLAGGTIFDSPTIAGQRRASQRLFEAGIPGHAYRGNADNYVFYPGTEDQIRILRKYGLLAPVAAGAAAGGDQ